MAGWKKSAHLDAEAMMKGRVIRLEESVKSKKMIKMKKIEPLEWKNKDFFFPERENLRWKIK